MNANETDELNEIRITPVTVSSSLSSNSCSDQPNKALSAGPPADTERYLKLKEVQTMLGVSRTTLWRWHAERGLKVVTIGGVTRIRQRDLESFLRKHEQTANPSQP
jgi:predicted DNA-binding transcriptional regulator AlpA